MARSAHDATRFTATAPYAQSKGPTTSTIPAFANPPPNETPQQKVARLRAAAKRARADQVSTSEKLLVIGRYVADKAHRATALTLIGATGICAAVALYSLGDMVVYNRKKRNAFFAEQNERNLALLKEAYEASQQGTATDDQVLLINRERAKMEALAQQEEKKGMFRRARDFLVSGLAKEEKPGGKLGVSAAVQDQMQRADGVPEKMASTADSAFREAEKATAVVKDSAQSARDTVEEKGLGIVSAVENARREGERAVERIHPSGGPLDQEAERAYEAVTKAPKGWTSWFSRN